MGSGSPKVYKQMVFASTMAREGLRQKCQPNPVPTAGAECPSMRDLGSHVVYYSKAGPGVVTRASTSVILGPCICPSLLKQMPGVVVQQASIDCLRGRHQ